MDVPHPSPSPAVPQYRTGSVVKYFDNYEKKTVTGIVINSERPLGYTIYTVKSRYNGRIDRMFTHNLMPVKGTKCT